MILQALITRIRRTRLAQTAVAATAPRWQHSISSNPPRDRGP